VKISPYNELSGSAVYMASLSLPEDMLPPVTNALGLPRAAEHWPCPSLVLELSWERMSQSQL